MTKILPERLLARIEAATGRRARIDGAASHGFVEGLMLRELRVGDESRRAVRRRRATGGEDAAERQLSPGAP